MILIAAVDDRGGLTFNRRRQSQDRILRQQILSMTAGENVSGWIIIPPDSLNSLWRRRLSRMTAAWPGPQKRTIVS